MGSLKEEEDAAQIAAEEEEISRVQGQMFMLTFHDQSVLFYMES